MQEGQASIIRHVPHQELSRFSYIYAITSATELDLGPEVDYIREVSLKAFVD